MKNRPDVKSFFHAFQKKLNCFLSHSTSISVSTTTTTTMTTYQNQGIYICECGYKKTIQNTDEQKGGLKTFLRLHSKVCPLVKSGARTSNTTYDPANVRLPDQVDVKLRQKSISDATSKVISDATIIRGMPLPSH